MCPRIAVCAMGGAAVVEGGTFKKPSVVVGASGSLDCGGRPRRSFEIKTQQKERELQLVRQFPHQPTQETLHLSLVPFELPRSSTSLPRTAADRSAKFKIRLRESHTHAQCGSLLLFYATDASKISASKRSNECGKPLKKEKQKDENVKPASALVLRRTSIKWF